MMAAAQKKLKKLVDETSPYQLSHLCYEKIL